MSQQERNGVRATYIHKVEHLDERRLMVQWLADYLDENQVKGLVRLSLVRLIIIRLIY